MALPLSMAPPNPNTSNHPAEKKMFTYLPDLVKDFYFFWFSADFRTFRTIFRYLGYFNLQILPLGNVRLFRRIRKNDAPFVKTCVFFA